MFQVNPFFTRTPQVDGGLTNRDVILTDFKLKPPDIPNQLKFFI